MTKTKFQNWTFKRKTKNKEEQLKILRNEKYEYNNACNITLSQTPKNNYICVYVQPHRYNVYTFIKKMFLYILNSAGHTFLIFPTTSGQAHADTD